APAPAGTAPRPAARPAAPTGTVPGPAASAAPSTRRDPLRVAARLSPLLGLGVSIALVWWGLETGVLRSLENLQVFIASVGAWGPVAFQIASAASVVFAILPAGLVELGRAHVWDPCKILKRMSDEG